MRRHASERCHGYFSADGRYAYCSREERAGSLSPHPTTGLFVHRLDGRCECGSPHADLTTGKESKASAAKPRIVKTYDYTDEQGDLLYQLCRTDPKGFFQRRPNGRGGWINSLGKLRRVPYRLEELLAVEGDEFLFVTEGEKDANAVANLGCIATTNAMGAKKWRREYNKYFTGRHPVLTQDNDSDGKLHCQMVARALRGVAGTIRILLLPDLPEHGDVSDWIDAQRAAGLDNAAIRDELLRLAEKAEIVSATNGGATEGATGTATADHPSTAWGIAPDTRTDLANAERCVKLHPADILYVKKHNRWHVWDGARYAQDITGELDARAVETIRSIYVEAAAAPTDTAAWELAKWAKTSQSAKAVAGLLRYLRAHDQVRAHHDVFDRQPMLLNVANGVIDLDRQGTKRLIEHDRALRLSRVVPVKYDPSAKAPRWERFLNEIFACDDPRATEEMVAFMKRSIGYSLTALTTERKFWVLWGEGHNGKSTTLKIIAALLGEYANRTPASTLLAKRPDAIPNDVAALDGARFAYASEPMEGRQLATALIKELTGDEPITARFMHGEWFTFRPRCKIWLATNNKPKVRDTSKAMWGRVLFVPFLREFSKNDSLEGELLAELPGILNWAIGGCVEWQEDGGLKPPKAVLDATEQYRIEEDEFAQWLSARCWQKPFLEAAAADLWDDYQRWATSEKVDAMNRNEFGRRLKARFREGMLHGGRKKYIGVGLREGDDEPTGPEQGSFKGT